MVTATELAERMYARRRAHDGLRTSWGGLGPRIRRSYEIMAEAALDQVSIALIRLAVARWPKRSTGGLEKDIQHICGGQDL